MTFISAATLLGCATLARAQGFGGYGGNNPYSNGGDSNSDSNGDSDNPFSSGNSGFNFGGFSFSHYQVVVTAHAVLACLAFAFLFPVGGIMIRLASFRGVWFVHGIFQIVAYIFYIAAFGLGIYMINSSPFDNMVDNAHPIIGIVLFVVLFFQPFLGTLHHLFFKKHSRRGFFSYAHIWLGRILITLGIINGGLGLQFAQRFRLAPPSTGAIIGYGVVAGLIWLIYVVSAFVGERRRHSTREISPPPYKEEYKPRQYT
ncbi:hypothetical protein PRZ48_000523 [Zasmidium cellare]|uniref:Cytochrome b561 domain-containing protein n=1 Tax=Zasmidium cellare TaxID=395010 RepID=A0ABR0F0E0_ZASCE|nr:hypothetical protein PRZ48_000523 [Zasmidium cellare]